MLARILRIARSESIFFAMRVAAHSQAHRSRIFHVRMFLHVPIQRTICCSGTLTLQFTRPNAHGTFSGCCSYTRIVQPFTNPGNLFRYILDQSSSPLLTSVIDWRPGRINFAVFDGEQFTMSLTGSPPAPLFVRVSCSFTSAPSKQW